jgi:adenylosuccinate lyase
VLLVLVEAGMSRDVAYRLVQEAARRVRETNASLREVLGAMPEVTKVLDAKALESAFDVQRVLRHAGRAVDALSDIGS